MHRTVADIRHAFDKTLASECFHWYTVDGAWASMLVINNRSLFEILWHLYIYICLSALALHKTVHTLCKSHHFGPLCIVLWKTGCTTLRNLPFDRYGRQCQISWRQPGRRWWLGPYVYSYQTQEAQLKPDCHTERRRIGSRMTSAYSFISSSYYTCTVPFHIHHQLTECLLYVLKLFAG